MGQVEIKNANKSASVAIRVSTQLIGLIDIFYYWSRPIKYFAGLENRKLGGRVPSLLPRLCRSLKIFVFLLKPC